MSADRSREGSLEPPSHGVRWFVVKSAWTTTQDIDPGISYEDAYQKCEAAPCIWDGERGLWIETNAREYLYDPTMDPNPPDTDDKVRGVWMPENRRFEMLDKSNAVLLGKTDEAISKGVTGTVSRYEGADGTETDTGVDDEVKNRFASVQISKWVAYTKINGTYYMIAAEC